MPYRDLDMLYLFDRVGVFTCQYNQLNMKDQNNELAAVTVTVNV